MSCIGYLNFLFYVKQKFSEVYSNYAPYLKKLLALDAGTELKKK